MRTRHHHHATRTDRREHVPVQPSLTLGTRWEGPTLDEFIERVEHEFGAASDLTGMLLAGAGPGTNLEPSDIRELCALLGVPPEDFGV